MSIALQNMTKETKWTSNSLLISVSGESFDDEVIHGTQKALCDFEKIIKDDEFGTNAFKFLQSSSRKGAFCGLRGSRKATKNFTNIALIPTRVDIVQFILPRYIMCRPFIEKSKFCSRGNKT